MALLATLVLEVLVSAALVELALVELSVLLAVVLEDRLTLLDVALTGVEVVLVVNVALEVGLDDAVVVLVVRTDDGMDDVAVDVLEDEEDVVTEVGPPQAARAREIAMTPPKSIPAPLGR